jgi:hypothetical protein
MNPTPAPRAERRRWWVFLFCTTGIFLVLLGIGVYRLFTLSRDALVLRRALVAENASIAKTQFEGSVGSFVIGGARLVVRFISEVPPEARQALGALKSASVGVYRLRSDSAWEERADHFALADAAMKRRGWTRIVGVSDQRQNVAIYFPAEQEEDDDLRVCVAVRDHSQLVVVQGEADAVALSRLVQSQLPKFYPRSP